MWQWRLATRSFFQCFNLLVILSHRLCMKRKAINEEDGCVLKQNYNRMRMNRVLQTKPECVYFNCVNHFKIVPFKNTPVYCR